MSNTIPERGWKYLRGIRDEMLSDLCFLINRRAVEIVNMEEETERDKYHKLYKHIIDSDQIAGDCFDDWRRSNISMKLLFLIRHNLLTEERISGLSGKGIEHVEKLKTLNQDYS
jgi:hypothetical protein